MLYLHFFHKNPCTGQIFFVTLHPQNEKNMINKRIFRFFVWVLCLLTVSCKDKEVEFTFSPETPRAGQSVSFTNQTSEGEKWEWNFGDGTSSTSKNPSKVYKRSGTYTVILTVDGKNSRRCAHTLTVVDTVPQITLVNDSLVYFMTPTKLQMSAYNPYNHTKTYEWVLSDDVELVDGSLTDEIITVIFKKHSQDIEVNCILTIGDDEFLEEESFYVNDTTAPALLMSSKGGFIAMQRMFASGNEEAGYYSLWAHEKKTTKIYSMAVEGDNLFLFFADSTEQGDIKVVSLQDGSLSRVIYNAAAGPGQGFYNGLCRDGMLYWTSCQDGMIYHVPTHVRERAFTAGTGSAQYWGDISHVGYTLAPGSATTGLALYNDYFFLGYGKGIYRFTAADRNSSTAPASGAILPDVAVKHFVIDPLTRKIYYLTEEGLHVCNMNGDNARLITLEADGNALCVDNSTNSVYWSQRFGVYQLPLIQSANNAFTDTPKQFNKMTGVEAIIVDPTPRWCMIDHEE